MSREELKTMLHESIENIDDDSLLVAVQEMLEYKYTVTSQPKLSEEQLDSLDKAKQEIAEGKFISNGNANNIADEWLSK